MDNGLLERARELDEAVRNGRCDKRKDDQVEDIDNLPNRLKSAECEALGLVRQQQSKAPGRHG